MPNADGYLSLKGLAAYSSLSVRTLRGYLVHPSRPLPCYRIGGKILVRRSEFDAWAVQFRTAPASAVDAIVADVLRGVQTRAVPARTDRPSKSRRSRADS